MRRVWPWFAAVSLVACGRTGIREPDVLLAQFVDAADTSISGATIELWAQGGGPNQNRIALATTDGDGVASFAYPGPGDYELRASIGPPCCFANGQVEASLSEPNVLVIIVATELGPCPTAVPRECWL